MSSPCVLTAILCIHQRRYPCSSVLPYVIIFNCNIVSVYVYSCCVYLLGVIQVHNALSAAWIFPTIGEKKRILRRDYTLCRLERSQILYTFQCSHVRSLVQLCALSNVQPCVLKRYNWGKFAPIGYQYGTFDAHYALL